MGAYELTTEQLALREAARKFAREVLHPVSMETEKAHRDLPDRKSTRLNSSHT